MNQPLSQNPLLFVKKVMNKYREETGGFQGLLMKGKSGINAVFEKQTVAMQFENCTLDLDVVTEMKTHQQFIQRFEIAA